MMNTEASRQTPAVLEACSRVFVRSARYEYLFWDMAWREEKWLP
jgi:thiaminase